MSNLNDRLTRLARTAPLTSRAALVLALACTAACSDATGSAEPNGAWTQDQFVATSDATAPVRRSVPGREPPSPDTSGLTSRALNPSDIVWKRWSKGEATTVLAPHRTHVCGLGMVRGDLDVGTILQISKSGDNWVMRGDGAGNNFLQMDALCVPFSAFRVNAGVAPTVSSIVSVGNSVHGTTRTATLTANAAPILTRVQGLQNGLRERKFVSQSGPSVGVRIGSVPSPSTAAAVSLGFGRTRMPFYNQGIAFELIADDDIIGFDCIPANCGLTTIPESFCFLTSVAGDMKGAEEWVSVYPDFAKNRWSFDANFGSDSIGLEMSCLSTEQRVLNPPSPR